LFIKKENISRLLLQLSFCRIIAVERNVLEDLIEWISLSFVIEGDFGGFGTRGCWMWYTTSWGSVEPGNECGDMVYGQEHSYWSILFSEQCFWKVIQSFSLVKGVTVLCFGILFNVALLSISTTRIWKEGQKWWCWPARKGSYTCLLLNDIAYLAWYLLEQSKGILFWFAFNWINSNGNQFGFPSVVNTSWKSLLSCLKFIHS